MPQYNSNNPGTIREVFSLEGDYLNRAGFVMPSDIAVRADDTLPKPVQAEPEVKHGLTGEVLADYERWLSIGDVALEG